MPRVKPLQKYPQELFALFERAYKVPEVLTFPSHTEADKFRQKLYSFRRSLRREHHLLAALASELSFHLNGPTLKIYSPKTSLARAILSQEKPNDLPDASSDPTV